MRSQDRARCEEPRGDRDDVALAERARERNDVLRFVAARLEALVVPRKEERRVGAAQEEQAFCHDHLDQSAVIFPNQGVHLGDNVAVVVSDSL